MKKQIKKFDFNAKYFEANGKKYRISDGLSLARWRHFEDLQAILGFGRTHDEIFQAFNQIWGLLDDKGGAKVASAAIVCHNAMTGIKTKLEERMHPALLMVALFANYEGEDQTVYDEDIMKQKVEDWQEEGYNMNDFFQLAWNLVPSFIKNYNDVFQNTSKPPKTKTKSEASSGRK